MRARTHVHAHARTHTPNPPTAVAVAVRGYLDQWPLVGLVEQLHNGWDAIVEAHGVLSHLGLRVAAGKVPQGTDGRLCDVILVPGSQDGVDESLHAAVLRHQRLVFAVVAGQVGEGACGAGEDVDVIHTQLVDQDLQYALQTLLERGRA